VWHTHPPAESIDTNDHTGLEPNRNTHALTATAITSTASASAPPAGNTGPNSGSNANAHRVKCALIASARAANRRSQPRTVSAGTPNRPAISRCPSPRTFASIAAPITDTSSRRRKSTRSGSSTCVPAHPRHFARRGRNTLRSPAVVHLTTRARACPHGPSNPRPRHDEHANNPPTSSASTRASSAHTINMGATSGIKRALPERQAPREGSRAFRNA